MNPMIPMPIVAIRIRSFGPTGRGASASSRLSAKTFSPRYVVATAGTADAAAADLRNDRRVRRSWCDMDFLRQCPDPCGSAGRTPTGLARTHRDREGLQLTPGPGQKEASAFTAPEG